MYEHIYGGIDVLIKNEFLISLLVAYIPFTFLYKKRRNYFYLRIPVAIIIVFCISNFVPFFDFKTDVLFVRILIGMLYYLTMVAVFVVAGFLIFKTTFWNALFCALGAYGLQHVINRAYTVFLNYLEFYCGIPAWVYIIVYWVALIGGDLLCYYFYLRKFVKNNELKTNNINLIIFCGFLLVATIFLHSIGSFMVMTGVNEATAKVHLSAVISLMSAVVCVVVMDNLFNNANNKKLETDIIKVKHLWEEDRKHYDLSKQYIEQINLKYHDLKYALNSALKDKSNLEDISNCIKEYDSFVKTGNETLDVLINEKSIVCNGLDIQLACIADGDIINHLNPVDIYSLLGNAIDNAIEAVINFADADKKYIELMMRRSGDMALIGVENPIENIPVFKNGLPQTTKPDKENHGFGLKSMKMIVEKYKGYMSINTDNSTFSLQIALPILN